MVPGVITITWTKILPPFISLETRFIEITLNIENFPTKNNSFDIVHFVQVLLCRRLFGVHLQFILPVSLGNQYCSMVAIISHVPCTFLKDWHIFISRENPKTFLWTKKENGMVWLHYANSSCTATKYTRLHYSTSQEMLTESHEIPFWYWVRNTNHRNKSKINKLLRNFTYDGFAMNCDFTRVFPEWNCRFANIAAQYFMLHWTKKWHWFREWLGLIRHYLNCDESATSPVIYATKEGPVYILFCVDLLFVACFLCFWAPTLASR